MTGDERPEQDPVDEWDDTVIVRRAAEEPDTEASELDETVVVDRSVAPVPEAAPDEPDEPGESDELDELGETVVVDRPAGEPVVVDRPAGEPVEPPLTPQLAFAPIVPAASAATEELPGDDLGGDDLDRDDLDTDIDDTVVSPRVAALEERETLPELDLDATRVVHREDDLVDVTRVVRRDDEGDDLTAADDDTIIARRPAAAHTPVASTPAAPSARAQLAPTRRSLRAQRTPIVLPSGTAASERAAAALGADAVVRYSPRPIPAPPAPGPDLGSGPEATRAEAPSMRSVRRATRSAGWIAVGSIAGACVVSIVGLVVIVTTVVGG